MTVEKYNTILKLNNSKSIEINVDDVLMGNLFWNNQKGKFWVLCFMTMA